MKKHKHIPTLKNKLLFSFLALISLVNGQPLPGGDYGPPDLPDKDTVMGGSAPIDNGIFFLIGFAGLYLFLKYRKEISLWLGSNIAKSPKS